MTSSFPDFNFISQGYEYGDDLAADADLSIKLNAELDNMSNFPQGYLTHTTSLVPHNSSFHYVQLYKDPYRGDVKVAIWELSVLAEKMWQVVWKP